MLSRKSLVPKGLQSFQFNIPSSIDEYEETTPSTEEEYYKPYQPKVTQQTTTYQPPPYAPQPKKKKKPKTPPTSPLPEYLRHEIRDEDTFANFFDIEMRKEEKQQQFEPAPAPTIKLEPVPSPSHPSEWKSLHEELSTRQLSFSSKITPTDFEFVKFYVHAKTHSNSPSLSIFLEFAQKKLQELSSDGSNISAFLFFISSVYENHIFNALMTQVFHATEEFSVKLDKNYHHGILVSKQSTGDPRNSVFVYHHLYGILSSSTFNSEEEKSNTLTLMKVAIGMNEIFNQLHILHLKIQSLLSNELYFGLDSFEPAASMMPLYQFMAIISEISSQTDEDYGELTPNILNLANGIQPQHKEFDAVNNDISIMVMQDIGKSTSFTTPFVDNMKQNLIRVFSDIERYLMK